MTRFCATRGPHAGKLLSKLLAERRWAARKKVETDKYIEAISRRFDSGSAIPAPLDWFLSDHSRRRWKWITKRFKR